MRREAKRHAALEFLSTIEKRCRRCALPPQSKPLRVGRTAPNFREVLKCGGPPPLSHLRQGAPAGNEFVVIHEIRVKNFVFISHLCAFVSLR